MNLTGSGQISAENGGGREILGRKKEAKRGKRERKGKRKFNFFKFSGFLKLEFIALFGFSKRISFLHNLNRVLDI